MNIKNAGTAKRLNKTVSSATPLRPQNRRQAVAARAVISSSSFTHKQQDACPPSFAVQVIDWQPFEPLARTGSCAPIRAQLPVVGKPTRARTGTRTPTDSIHIRAEISAAKRSGRSGL
jgi:hypothetical protein